MKILIVSATDIELQGIKSTIEQNQELSLKHQYQFLTTGIGVAASTFATTKALLINPVDFVIQVGIAGSFSSKIGIGEVVWVVKDGFSDMGAATDDGFLSLKMLNLAESDSKVEFRSENNTQIPLPETLARVSAVTSDTIHHQPMRINEIVNQFNPAVESMEGAAIMSVCNQLNVSNIQVRSISNFVAPREENQWNLELALSSLNNWFNDYFKMIEK